MALFRRASKGRHALGAAVTSIPTGPLQERAPVPVPVPAAAPAVEAPAPPGPSWHQPHVMDSIAELLATGEAWSTEPPPPPAWREPVGVPVPVQVQVQPAPAPEPIAPAAPVVPARTALEAALADLLPEQPEGGSPTGPPVEPPLVAAPRVQLGFRDGTSTSLDPSSSQSRALQELAQTLTRRD